MSGWIIAHRPHVVGAIRVALGLAGVLAILGALSLVAGCSAGPQLPVTATPQNTSCNYTITIGAIPSDDASIVAPSGTDGTAGVIVSDNDCSIDRIAASADPTTVGNDNRGARVDAELPITVSGTGAP